MVEKADDVRVALDLSEEWRGHGPEGNPDVELAMGCLVVRREFAAEEGGPRDFLAEYQESTAFANEHQSRRPSWWQNTVSWPMPPWLKGHTQLQYCLP